MEEIKEKECSKCCKIKPFTEFHKNKTSRDGYRSQCKLCSKEYQKIYHKTYQIKDKEKRKQYLRNYEKTRKSVDPFFKLIRNLRSRIVTIVKKYKLSKDTTTIQLLGCDIETLMNHLQPTGMRYDPNFNIYDYDSTLYHIDHIKTFADVEKGIYTLEEVCHYTNLQILPAEMNLSKSGTSW